MLVQDEKKVILACLMSANEPISVSDFKGELIHSVSSRTIRRLLNDWVEQGVVERTGKNKGTRYRYIGLHKKNLPFIENLDQDIRDNLLKQIRDSWTHSSTAIEGNTLTLGDTHFLLEEGLTISGKSINEHQEVLGHAKAIDLIYDMLNHDISEEDLFKLHLSIQTESLLDIFKPNGAYKVEPNGTYVVSDEGKHLFLEYASHLDVEFLMNEVFEFINTHNLNSLSLDSAANVYAKLHIGIAHIHPFYDGNGRIARLVANIPLLKAGLPPLIISQEKRREYIQILARYQLKLGQRTKKSGVWQSKGEGHLDEFIHFCKVAYSTTQTMIEQANSLQKKRNKIT